MYDMNAQPTPQKPTILREICGTIAGNRAHTKAKEKQCKPCLEARREYDRQRRAKKLAGEPTRQQTKAEKRAQDNRSADAVIEATPAAPEPEESRVPAPRFLKHAGRRLWIDVTGEYDLSPASLSVLASVCRMTDQAERFTAALSARSALWFELSEDDQQRAADGGVPIVVNAMVSEHRQLSNTIRTSLNQIGVLKTSASSKGNSVIDEVRKRRAERLAQQADESKGTA